MPHTARLQEAVSRLPAVVVAGRPHLAYQTVTDLVAAHLFPHTPPAGIDETAYQQILETADSLCRVLGYTTVTRLAPPHVPIQEAGLYWRLAVGDDAGQVAPEATEAVTEVAAGASADPDDPGDPLMAELAEVCGQHFTIPVRLSDAARALIERAVAHPHWGNDAKGIMHDILGMAIKGGQDVSPSERRFTVIIRGAGARRYWPLKLLLRHEAGQSPYLLVALAEEAVAPAGDQLFELGRCVMTPAVEDLGIDPLPLLARHAAGDWSHLNGFDRRQNKLAVKHGGRILSAYDVTLDDGETARVWALTEADRSVTTILLPEEY